MWLLLNPIATTLEKLQRVNFAGTTEGCYIISLRDASQTSNTQYQQLQLKLPRPDLTE